MSMIPTLISGEENNLNNFDLTVVIPFLNEEEGIPFLVNSLNEYFGRFNSLKVEVVFVDDGSTDKSVELLKSLNHNTYKHRIVKLSKNFGSINALYAGITNSRSPLITFNYSDLQDPLYLIEKMYAKHLEGYDIIWAERRSVNINELRIFSKLYSRLMQKYAVPGFPENGYDVAMFNEKVKEYILKNIESNSSIFLQILSLGFKQAKIEYDKESRKIGKSKWTLKKKIKLVIDSFVSYSYAPIRFVSVSGILISLIGFVYGLFILVYKLSGHPMEYGWPGLIIILMIGFGLTNISLGIIAEYLWRTLDSSRKRPVFIVDEVIDE